MRSQPDDSPVHISQEACNFARTAYRALLVEVNLTPKPGLVDRHNTGAHHDMELSHFYRSARAIGVWLPRFIKRGMKMPHCPPRSSWRGCGRWAWPVKTTCSALQAVSIPIKAAYFLLAYCVPLLVACSGSSVR